MDYIKDCEFRIKKMNAIEALALQTSSSMKSVDATQTGGSDSIIDENPRKIF